MSEEHGWYLTELGERAATITRLEAELVRWKNRVRELEDAILIHDRDTTKPTERDHDLYGRMGELWT